MICDIPSYLGFPMISMVSMISVNHRASLHLADGASLEEHKLCPAVMHQRLCTRLSMHFSGM